MVDIPNQPVNRIKRQRSVKNYIKHFPKKEYFLEHLVECLYGLESICVNCKEPSGYYPVGSGTHKFYYCCVRCSYEFDPLEGTIFEGKRMEFGNIFYALLMCAATNGEIKTKVLSKELNIPYPTAQVLKKEIVTKCGFKKKRGPGRPKKK